MIISCHSITLSVDYTNFGSTIPFLQDAIELHAKISLMNSDME